MDLHLAERWPDGQALLANQYYFDELYAATVVGGIFSTARILSRLDTRVINAGVNACASAVQIAGWIARMIEKHVVDRMVDVLVSGLRSLVLGSWSVVFRSSFPRVRSRLP